MDKPNISIHFALHQMIFETRLREYREAVKRKDISRAETTLTDAAKHAAIITALKGMS